MTLEENITNFFGFRWSDGMKSPKHVLTYQFAWNILSYHTH